MSPGETLVKNRLIGFLIWESIASSSTYLLLKTLNPLLPQPPGPTTISAVPRVLLGFLAFLTFILSNLIFSASLYVVASPQPGPPASPSQLLRALFRSVFADDDEDSQPLHRRRRVRLSLLLAAFVFAAGVSGLVSLVSIAGYRLGRFAVRGFASGLIYSLVYVYKRRWVLEFPIIQRPLFFSFKMVIPQAISKAFKLTNAAYVLSTLVLAFVPGQASEEATLKRLVADQLFQYIGTFVVFLCWELSRHLHQVLHTKRFVFAPPKGSAAAETNPSEPLFEALESSAPGSLVQYLAYLDLCMVCEYNVDTWRRAAFFEESGETYKKIVAVCLRPLEQLSSNLIEGLEGSPVDKEWQLSNQIKSPADSRPDSGDPEPLSNLQLCAWSARALASLTARSRKEDRFGVAQLSGSNAAVISTLISCLLAVEASMGKKTNLQPPSQFMGPGGIKWATPNAGGRVVVSPKKKNGPVHAKAYAMADVLRTSVYCIVSTFHNEMLSSAKSGLLEKDWLISGKPLFGSQELLIQKLRLFLEFRAS